MRIVILSDTHSQQDELDIPNGDVLIHCGDFTGNKSWKRVEEFNHFLGQLNHRHKIVVAGNHDMHFESENQKAVATLSNATYLQDSEITIDGINFYGSPWTPCFFDWYFMADQKKLKTIWQKIPENIDILITHGPPKGILDLTADGVNAGCEELLKRVLHIKPKFHVFGHIHEGYGMIEIDGIKFINASNLDFHYRPANQPVVVDI